MFFIFIFYLYFDYKTIPGLSDHDAIFVEIYTHPHINEIPGRKIPNLCKDVKELGL